MRFSDVLTFNNFTYDVGFNFKKLFEMQDIRTSDIEHIGHVVKCLMLSGLKYTIFKIPYLSLEFVIDNYGNGKILKPVISDFTMGLCVTLPMIGLALYTFKKFLYKPYIAFGIGIVVGRILQEK